ncbi:hypothetical protein [Nodularia sp. NIES-3585]|nr:hypothetical protein [Nodularia sp. NIES-3585]
MLEFKTIAFELTSLLYNYDVLEPDINIETMRLHHERNFLMSY